MYKRRKEKRERQPAIQNPTTGFQFIPFSRKKSCFDAVDLILNGYDEACVVSRRQNYGLYA